MTQARLTFLGAAGTVTGSKTLVDHVGGRLLVDCGLFQGIKHLRQMNWADLPVPPASIDAVVLTHAHIDHSGYLPVLVRNGFKGPIYTTPATSSLCRILWPDAAFLQTEEADRANRKGYSRHKPALPLFNVKDAEAAIAQLVEVTWGQSFTAAGATVTLHRVGHILGASMALVEVDGRRVLFSGDVGRPVDPLHGPPDARPDCDVMVLESTYGDRLHEPIDPEAELAKVVNRTVDRGGIVIVPAFAVGRTQRLLYHLWRLKERRAIRNVPIYLNSPLADKATRILAEHPEAHCLSPEDAEAVCGLPIIARTAEDSIRLNQRKDPAIVIAGSGMATGGRVVHHLRAWASDPRHTVLFTGFQAEGTRGDRMLRGERELKIFGTYIPVRCEVDVLHNLSAHADWEELLGWLGGMSHPPAKVLLNHGSTAAADHFRLVIQERLGWDVDTPLLGDVVQLPEVR